MATRDEASARRMVVTLLVLPVVVYVGVALAWRAQGIYRITGDEPHYLLIADSLLRRHDLAVRDDYFLDTPVHRAAGIDLAQPIHLTHVIGGYSIHAIGLPLLLLLPYRIGGPTGARLFLALVAGLIPVVLYRAVRRVMPSPGRRAWLACALAIGLPFAAAANQIYPDLLAGVLILYLAGTVAASFAGERDHPTQRWGTILAIAFLPWLHVRLLAPATILLLAYLYGLGIARRDRVLRVLLTLACLAVSLSVLAAYNVTAFGRATGVYDAYSLSFDPKRVGITFLGLHFDVVQGMFMQQPLLLLGLVGLPAFLGRNPRLGVVLVAVYLSVVVPNAMHINWYGGYSLVGRFAWPVIMLWMFPLAAAIDSARNPDRLCIAVCASSIALQLVLATRWLTVDSLLMARLDVPWWAPTGAYAALLKPAVWIRLPSFHAFHDPDACLRHPTNWIVVALALVLVALGWLRPRASRWIRPGCLACFVVAVMVVAFVPVPLSPWSIAGERLPGIVGQVDGTARSAIEARDGPGVLTFGPYVRLPGGRYEAVVRYESDGGDPLRAGQWEIVLGDDDRVPTRFAAGDLPASAMNAGTLRAQFTVPKKRRANVFQFRVYYPGRGNLSVRDLTLTPVKIGRAAVVHAHAPPLPPRVLELPCAGTHPVR